MSSKQTDRELLLRALFTTAPYQQARLVFRIPDDVQLLDVVNFYRAASWPNEKVRCAVCHAARHRDGLTALLSDGTRALVGSTCGERQFGIVFRHAKQRLELERDRQYELRMLSRFRLVAKDVVAALYRWKRPVSFLEARRSTFSRYLGSLYAALQVAHVRDGDALMKVIRIRNYAAQRGQDPYILQRQPSVRIRGGKLFDSLEIVKAYNSASDYVERYAAIALAHGTEQWNTPRLSSARRKLEDAIRKLSDVQAIFEAAEDFFGHGNLKAIHHWAYEELPALDFEVEGRELVHPSGARVGMANVPDLDPAVIELVAEWRRAD